MKYGQQYFKNRKAVKQITQSIEENCITIKQARDIGISESKIRRWEKEGKIGAIIGRDGKIKLYNARKLLSLDSSG